LKLKYDTLLSRLGFKFKWNPYATGETATFRLARAGKADKRGKIEGEVCDARGARAFLIEGNASHQVFARLDPAYRPPPGAEPLLDLAGGVFRTAALGDEPSPRVS